ncbi:MAG TPA: thioredoxin family protein [Chitinophagaceae bacterium]|nr:thioredoxin family protein [Chitinophagaceae bacterium]
MKKLFLSALPVAALAVMMVKPVADPLPIGSTIPKAEVKMKDISGKEVSFKDAIKKNGLLVMFSCNTCPVVHKYESRTVAICKKALDKNIGVILLNSNEASRDDGDSYDDMKDYAKKLGYTWNYVVDTKSTMADAFGANRTPECFLFDKNGKLVYHGAIDDNSAGPDEVTRKHLSIAIDESIAGKDVSTKNTRSVGCSIKRL